MVRPLRNEALAHNLEFMWDPIHWLVMFTYIQPL